MLFRGPSLAGVLGSVVAHSDSLKLLVCVTASAAMKKKLAVKPPRVEFYVETVVPQCNYPTFKSHFRMTRTTFEVRKL